MTRASSTHSPDTLIASGKNALRIPINVLSPVKLLQRSNMGAPRVTPTEIVEMQKLYRDLGTYSAVAKRLNRSVSTVSRYIQMKDIPRNIRITVENLST